MYWFIYYEFILLRIHGKMLCNILSEYDIILRDSYSELRAVIKGLIEGRFLEISTENVQYGGECIMSELQTVVFNLNGQLFGADASQIFQIIKYQEVTKVPGMPKFIEGIINYRGFVLPVINLARRFDTGEIEVTKKTKILITRIDGKFAGFIVNDVSEIIKFSDGDIEPAPLIDNSEVSAYLKKVGKKGDKLISIIDFENVLNNNEIKRLSVKPSKA